MRYNLSEITELIRNRRTIYPEQYTERVVQRDMLETILTNGLWAPTHGKTQPWRFFFFFFLKCTREKDGKACLKRC